MITACPSGAGMAVGKNIYGRKNELLLTRGIFCPGVKIELARRLHFLRFLSGKAK